MGVVTSGGGLVCGTELRPPGGHGVLVRGACGTCRGGLVSSMGDKPVGGMHGWYVKLCELLTQYGLLVSLLR